MADDARLVRRKAEEPDLRGRQDLRAAALRDAQQREVELPAGDESFREVALPVRRFALADRLHQRVLIAGRENRIVGQLEGGVLVDGLDDVPDRGVLIGPSSPLGAAAPALVPGRRGQAGGDETPLGRELARRRHQRFRGTTCVRKIDRFQQQGGGARQQIAPAERLDVVEDDVGGGIFQLALEGRQVERAGDPDHVVPPCSRASATGIPGGTSTAGSYAGSSANSL